MTAIGPTIRRLQDRGPLSASSPPGHLLSYLPIQAVFRKYAPFSGLNAADVRADTGGPFLRILALQ
jgi:hypothetical protein